MTQPSDSILDTEPHHLSPPKTVQMDPDEADQLRRRISSRRVALLLYYGDEVRSVPLSGEQAVIVGRSAPSHLAIQDERLSRQHARFELRGDRVHVADLESTNGTFVNGDEIDSRELRDGDVVSMGGVTAVLNSVVLRPPYEGIDSHDQFMVLLQAEVTRARYFRRPLAFVSMRRKKSAAGVLERNCARLREILRPVDRMALFGPHELQLLLPELDEAAARKVCERTLEQVDDAMRIGLSVLPGTANNVESLVDAAREAALQADADRPIRISEAAGARALSLRLDRAGGAEADATKGPVVVSPAMLSLLDTAQRLGRSRIPVLINGETGVGKEVIARAIHDAGPRRSKPMLCVNCGAVPEQLVESVLFGHERGAFTGANARQKGVFETADGGTVLLDEIGEMPAQAQVALLRVLESGQFSRVGSNDELTVDVRVIAATHRDLEAMCKAGDFRWDLFFRLNVMMLGVPPLRERSEDIEALTTRFIERANEANDCTVAGISDEAKALLRRYRWPGNVRELKNALERAVVVATGAEIAVEDLPERIVREATMPSSEDFAPALAPMSATPTSDDAEAPELEDCDGNALKAELRRHEKRFIIEALSAAGWNQSETARRLGVPRRTLVHKMRTLGIQRPEK